MRSLAGLLAVGAVAFLVCAIQLASGASFQQVRVPAPATFGSFVPRSRGSMTPTTWTNTFNYILSYGATPLDSREHFTLLKVNFGTLYRALANTTFQLEQPGFSVSSKASLPILPNPVLDVYASARTRGAVALTYFNTSRPVNSTLGTSDQPYLNLFGGNSNGNLSDLTLQLYFTLLSTPDASQPGGVRYTSNASFGAFSAGNPAAFAREGHTGAVSRANLPGDIYGRLYYFGGKNGTTWFNTLFYQDTGVIALQTLNPTGPPSPRAYHGMVALDTEFLEDRYLFVWGGETADGVYANDGPFLYDITLNAWIDHAATGAPVGRMGFVLLTLNDPDVVYMFGGMSGTNAAPVFYNDLWSYRVSNHTWTELPTGQGAPIIGGAERRPAARAFAQAAAFDATQFIIFGGENSQGPQNDFWSVNVNLTCPYYCVHPVDERFAFSGACMDYQQCHFIKDCAWDPNFAFQCFLDCVDAPSQCASRLNQFTCPTGLQKCWSGFCQEKLENCKPYPACEPGERRCGDNGDCVPETTVCNPVTCTGGLKLCADGSCRATCFPSYGCLPDDKPIQCDNGQCAATSAACNSGCTNATLPKKCWQGCVADTEDCSQPYWTDDIHLLAFTTPQQEYYRLYRKDGQIQDPEDLRGIIHLDKIPRGFNMTIYMKSTYDSELRQVGPHPTWSKEFDSSYMRSIFVKTNVTNVVEAYTQGSGGINIIFRMKLNANETAYWAYHPGHGLGYIAATNCVAMAIPWFWDDMDLAPDSQLANVSYIKAYREKMDAISKNLTYTGPEPTPPALRWQCQLLEPGNAWPRFTNVTDDILIPTADRYVGIRITNDFFERTMGIIYAPFPLPAPLAVIPAATLPPADPIVTYVVLAIAAALLLALIIVVLVKTFAQRN